MSMPFERNQPHGRSVYANASFAVLCWSRVVIYRLVLLLFAVVDDALQSMTRACRLRSLYTCISIHYSVDVCGKIHTIQYSVACGWWLPIATNAHRSIRFTIALGNLHSASASPVAFVIQHSAGNDILNATSSSTSRSCSIITK